MKGKFNYNGVNIILEQDKTQDEIIEGFHDNIWNYIIRYFDKHKQIPPNVKSAFRLNRNLLKYPYVRGHIS